MKTTTIPAALLLFAGLSLAAPAQAQRRGPDRPAGGKPTAPETLEVPQEPGIAWFGTWEAGLAEAERTGRPILIMSAAPQCSGVPGMW